MAKVLPCTGDGLAVDENGGVTVYGPRDLKWKLGTTTCNIDQHNGLKVDPETHKMWVSPDSDVRWTQYGTKLQSYTPTHTGTHAYTPIKLSLTTRDCTKTHARLRLSNGFTAWFMNAGDYWVQRLQVDALINGATTHSTSETVAFGSASATVYIGTGHPDFLMSRTLEPNTTIDVTVRFFLDILAYSSAGTNRVDLRTPNVNLSYWSFPMSAEQTEKVRYWKSGDEVGIETTTTWTDPDGGREVGVAGAAPEGSRIIGEAEYQRVVEQQNADRAVFEANARTILLKRVADKQSAIEKLTQLGLSEDQARALTS